MMMQQLSRFVKTRVQRRALYSIYAKYARFTMIPDGTYVQNLELAAAVRTVAGAVVECGVWRGGMTAGLAEVLGPSREYVLCDSFEGLPPAQAIDGPAAKAWQQNTTGAMYHDNCSAPEDVAKEAMRLSPATKVRYLAGWFNETLPTLAVDQGIALLRLDGDWYDSTMTCLTCLYDQVVPGGLIVIDDYHTWDGCSRAVHDFLSQRKLDARIRQWNNDVCYLRVPEMKSS